MTNQGQPRWIRIGKVARSHGVRGELLVRADDPESTSLLDQERLYLRDAQGEITPCRILGARVSQGEYRIRLEGVDDRDKSDALRGREVLLTRDQLPPLEPGEYYSDDLIGLEAFRSSGEPLGRVATILHTGGVPVLEVHGEREWQVPLVEQFVLRIDVEGRRIELEPPEEEPGPTGPGNA